MKKDNRIRRKNKCKIADVAITQDRLTGRAGLVLFVKYISGIWLLEYMGFLFGGIRKSRKGLGVIEMFKQAICFFIDGTSRHLVYFDHIKKDEGYAATIETTQNDMASSHIVKRFFKQFSIVHIFLFRRVQLRLFLWRLHITKPEIIELGIDTMVLDNDDAEKREGVNPTYKKKKGFQPLQMNWGRFFVDAVFRSGEKHSNYGDDVEKMILRMVRSIRKNYRAEVPILIRMDSGFFDQKIFDICEKLGIGYICGGKIYKDIKQFAGNIPASLWNTFQDDKGKDYWEYFEFGDKRGTWRQFRRALYCRLKNDGQQLYIPGFRPDTLIYTNIGMGQKIDEQLTAVGMEEYFNADRIIASYHERGCDELSNRGLKDFGHEELPFLKFNANAAWYYTMLISHFLFEAFKEDVLAGTILPDASYASTVRRQLIDLAGKVVRHGGKIILKITEAAWKHLRFFDLWERCNNPPQLPDLL